MAAHRRLARRSLREAFQQSSLGVPAAHEAPSSLQGSYILQQVYRPSVCREMRDAQHLSTTDVVRMHDNVMVSGSTDLV